LRHIHRADINIIFGAVINENLNDEVILISYSKNTGKVTSKLEDPSLIGEN